MDYKALLRGHAGLPHLLDQPLLEDQTFEPAPINRRQFVKLSTVAGLTGLALGIAPSISQAAAGNADGSVSDITPPNRPSNFVYIAPNGDVTVQINRLEFGQGTHTGLARILAEELDADWARVNAELAPAGAAYADPKTGSQLTGGSNAIKNSYMQYRQLGARMRAMLMQAAAMRWQVDTLTVSTRAGVLLGPDGRSAGYGEFAQAAMTRPIPQDVVLKNPAQFRMIGHSTRRLDTPAKTLGSQLFGFDVTRPNVKTVLIARPPYFGGTIAEVNADAAKQVAGVIAVLRVPLDRGAEGVAVVADKFWQAKRGRDALQINWQAPSDIADTEEMTAAFSALLRKPGLQARQIHQSTENPVARDQVARNGATKIIEAEFKFPFLAHTPMEPLNATIEVVGDGASARCHIWSGTQIPAVDQAAVASVLGLQPEQVHVQNVFAGGGFGRRATATADCLSDTARVMKRWLASGRREPLKVVWTREDDVQGGYYRPFTMHRARIGVDAAGNVLAWQHTVVSPSIIAGTPFEAYLPKSGIDHATVEGLADSAYPLPITVDVHHPTIPVPTLWWRSVGHTHTAFVMETLVDELAEATGKDAVTFRRELLSDHPRHLAALDLVIEKSGYGDKQLPSDQAWGVAIHESFNSVVAYVVEVSLTDGQPRVHQVTGAIHCNMAVNPSAVVAQVQGAAIMGLGMTIAGAEITLVDGRVQQRNFDSYRVPRISDVPSIDVYIVPSTDPPTGVGEPGLPPIAPAVANAIRRLTGQSQRQLPFVLT